MKSKHSLPPGEEVDDCLEVHVDGRTHDDDASGSGLHETRKKTILTIDPDVYGRTLRSGNWCQCTFSHSETWAAVCSWPSGCVHLN